MPDPARCLTARPPWMSPAVYPTQRATFSFNSVWNVSPGEPDLSLTPSYCAVAFSAPIAPRTRLPCKHRPGHAHRSLQRCCTCWGLILEPVPRTTRCAAVKIRLSPAASLSSRVAGHEPSRRALLLARRVTMTLPSSFRRCSVLPTGSLSICLMPQCQ